MGRIWVADDTRLARRVAIKELLEPTGMQRARFDRELSLTSRLEHPAIVAIHDRGVWADGTPFYVMKLVSGEALDREIARASTLAERMALLPRGLAVVHAVAYAHAHGIVHRDLKPANVITGEFGETVVIDWGLAKDLHAAPPEAVEGGLRERVRFGQTIGGEVLGTPAYMPPEQALGDAVAERADVYALGALYYHLLSGVAPHHGGSVDAVLASVISNPPEPLARRAPAVPADLVAIVAKAMARRPEDRYATAAELALDLERFHSGQLVAAHRYSGRQLLQRWLRKHRVPVMIAAVAAVALAVVGFASFMRIVREERAATAARGLAEQHRMTAEASHAQAEDLVGFMLVDLREKLEPVGKLELLESVALEARDYYRGQPDAKTPAEQDRRALAHHGVGRVLAAQGHAAASLAEHRNALVLHMRLAMTDPATWQPSLVRSYGLYGDALRNRGESDAALQAYQAALAINKRRAAEAPNDVNALDQLASSHTSIGDFYEDVRLDATQALAEHQRALALRSRVVELAPDARRNRELARSHANVGDDLAILGEQADAKRHIETALRLAKELVEADPVDALARRVAAEQHEALGVLLHNQRDLAAAVENYTASLAISESLLLRDPTNAQLAGRLARAHMSVGQIRDEQGELDAALASHRKALEIVDSLLRRGATSIRFRSLGAVLERQIGSVLERKGMLGDAIAAFQRSRVTSEQIAADEPTNLEWQERLRLVYRDLGFVLVDRGQRDEALALHERALAIAETIAAGDPSNTHSQVNVITTMAMLAQTREARGEHAQAKATFERALVLAEQFVARTPGPHWEDLRNTLRRDLARCCRTKRRARN